MAVPARSPRGVGRGGSRTDDQRREVGGRTGWRGGEESERADQAAAAEGSGRTKRGEMDGEIARASRTDVSEQAMRRKRVDRNGRGLSDGGTPKDCRSSDINHEGRPVKKVKR